MGWLIAGIVGLLISGVCLVIAGVDAELSGLILGAVFGLATLIKKAIAKKKERGMKRLLIILAVLLALVACTGMTQEVDNLLAKDDGIVAVDAWDESNLLFGETYEYVWFAVDASISVDYQDSAQLEEIARTTIPQAAFVFSPTPRMIRYVGAVIEITAIDGTVTMGTIIWSFEPGSVATEMGGTFAIGPSGGVIVSLLSGLRVE